MLDFFFSFLIGSGEASIFISDMNSTTLPPLKPRNNKLYGGVGGGVGSISNANTNTTMNLNATIATSSIRTSKLDAGGRNSSSSNGIQVQQLYDNSAIINGSSSHKNYLNNFQHNNFHNSNNINHSSTTSNMNINNNNNNNNNNFSQQNGGKSPSADSLNSNKSFIQQNVTQSNNVNTKNSHQNANSFSTNQPSNVNTNNQQISTAQQLNSTSMRRTTNPMTPETAMKNYMQKLTTFEHHEIFNYPEIYFLGQNAKKIHGIIGGPNNNGFDDENGK